MGRRVPRGVVEGVDARVWCLPVVEVGVEEASLLLRALRAERRRLELEVRATLGRIKRLEEEHGMSSKEFLERFKRGELGDREEYIEWYGELVFLDEARRELEEVKRLEEKLAEKLRGEGVGEA